MSFIQYIGNFENSEGSNIQVTISDLSTGSISDPPSYVHMTLDESGYEDETENTYDPFEPIRGSRGFLYVKTDNNVGLRTFSSGEDGRFRVDVSQSSQAILSGYLVMDDNVQKYLPNGTTMQLLFNDGLGLLKNKEFRDFDGELPTGYISLLDAVLWCLKKTNLDFDVKIAVNLFEENHDDRDVTNDKCPFKQTYIKAHTFEKDYGEMEDCYTVLTKILSSFNARIYQHHGAWWITRIPEYYNFGLSYTWYTWDGTVVSGTIEQQFDKYVGHADNAGVNAYFINTENDVRIKRPAKNTTRLFNYNFPELPRNKGYEKGPLKILVNPGVCRTIKDTVTGLYVVSWDGLTGFTWGSVEVALCFTSDTERNNALSQLGNPLRYVAEDQNLSNSLFPYEFSDWTLTIGINGGGLAVVDGYIASNIVNGYEIERFIEITGYVESQVVHLVSNPFTLCENDKFTFSFDWRLSTDVPGSGSISDAIAFIRLYGDDGTYWTLDNNGTWQQSNASFSVNFSNLFAVYTNNLVNQAEWQTFSVTSKSLPVSGAVRVSLRASSLFHTSRRTNFANIGFDIKKYVNGNYKEYNYEEYKIEQAGDYPEQDESESYLADTPCFEYKGAMFYENSGYFLTTNWHDWALQNGGITGLGDDRFVKWAAYELHNWNRRQRYKITADFARLNSNTNNHIGLHHRVLILGNTEAATYKRYVITYLRRNWRDCTFTANLVEIYDTTESGRFGDTFTFKYKV